LSEGSIPREAWRRGAGDTLRSNVSIHPFWDRHRSIGVGSMDESVVLYGCHRYTMNCCDTACCRHTVWLSSQMVPGACGWQHATLLLCPCVGHDAQKGETRKWQDTWHQHRQGSPIIFLFRWNRWPPSSTFGTKTRSQLVTTPKFWPHSFVSPTLHPRRKKDGDRFRPTWRDRPAKLKDFLRGQGVPLHRRDQVALICDQDDTVRGVEST